MTSATAPGKLPAAVDATHQAGGGLSGQERNIKKFEPGVLAHLNNIYQAQTKDQTWKPEQVADWLRNVQGDDDAELAKDFAPAQSETGWDKTSFLTYLSSPTANVIAPPKPQDMSWPLSSYFVSSSHNTYLTGNQLSSDSSADAYKNVLLRGCRCIEIDVWDGSDSETSEEGDDTSSSSSSSSSDDDEAKYQKRKERVKKVKSKVPSSFLSKLSLGKKLDKYAEKKKPSSSSEESGAKTGTTEGEEEPVVAGKDTRDAGSVGAAANAAGEVLKKIPSIKEPRVLHGFTLTKDITFREVCDAVREYGFVASDLPLIVSLEVHCSPEQQEAMVHIMEQTWQGLLLPTPKEDAQSLPAPGDLRGKILVKVKYAPPNQPEGGDVTPPSEPDEAAAAAAASAAAAGKKPPANKASKIIQALSRLGIYTRGVSFKSLTQPEAAMPTHIFSLSEGGVMEVHEKQRKALFDHNRHFLMRAYPSGLRIRSSNLDPAVFWRKGIQIVALNWQNWDEGMMLNEGMFAGTGGYVLKPVGMFFFSFSPLITTHKNSLELLTDHETQATEATRPSPHPNPQQMHQQPKPTQSCTTTWTFASPSSPPKTCLSPQATRSRIPSGRTSRSRYTSKSPASGTARTLSPTTAKKKRASTRPRPSP